MVVICCGPLCPSTSKAAKVSFHKFTKTKRLEKMWMWKMKVDNVPSQKNPKPFRITKHTRICSLHFQREDFIIRSQKSTLKPLAVPSIFPWTQKPKLRRPITKTKLLELAAMSSPDNVIKQDNVLEVHEEQNVICVSEPPTFEETVANKADKFNTTCENVLINTISVDDITDPMGGQDVTTCETAVDYRKLYVDALLEIDKYKSLWQREKSIADEMQRTGAAEAAHFHVSDVQQHSDPYQDVKLQTNVIFSIDMIQTSDVDMQYFTGFPNFDIFLSSLTLLFGQSENNSVVMKHNFKLGSRSTKLSRNNQYLLLLMKLRQNLGYHFLSFLFKISESTVCDIVISWTNYIYIRIGSLDIWPHRNVLFARYSEEFLHQYPSVIGSLDATEFFIQTPSSLVTQSQTYSHYKSHNTMKSLLVVDGNGSIIFVSALFTGSISDKALVVESGLIDLLRSKLEKQYLHKGDIFLADKGFKIHDLLATLDLELNIPTFRVGNVQFTLEEVQHNQKISHERIHVERAIGRLKSYKILAHTYYSCLSLGYI